MPLAKMSTMVTLTLTLALVFENFGHNECHASENKDKASNFVNGESFTRFFFFWDLFLN
jgi:hypothetical protein